MQGLLYTKHSQVWHRQGLFHVRAPILYPESTEFCVLPLYARHYSSCARDTSFIWKGMSQVVPALLAAITRPSCQFAMMIPYNVTSLDSPAEFTSSSHTYHTTHDRLI